MLASRAWLEMMFDWSLLMGCCFEERIGTRAPSERVMESRSISIHPPLTFPPERRFVTEALARLPFAITTTSPTCTSSATSSSSVSPTLTLLPAAAALKRNLTAVPSCNTTFKGAGLAVADAGAAVCPDAFDKSPASNKVSTTAVLDILILHSQGEPWSAYIVSTKASADIVTGVTAGDPWKWR
jgi:hypothetical protein